MNKKTPEAKIIVALTQVEELSLKKKRDIIRREFKRKVRKEIYEDEYDERIF